MFYFFCGFDFIKLCTGVFYDGINPKLVRAAINHGVTFYVYDFIINLLDKAGYATLASQ